MATGRDQARSTATGAAHEPNLALFYSQQIAPITPGDFDLQLTLLRPGASSLVLEDAVESLDWAEEPGSSMLSGSLALRRPDPEDNESLPIGYGHLVRCRVYWGARWYELWTMRCAPPDTTVGEGIVIVTLEDDMALLRRTRRDYVFRRSRATRPFYAHEIAATVARRNGVKVGTLAKGRHPIRKLIRRDATAATVIAAAYAAEREATGRQFVMRMRNGRLEVVTFKRNTTLYLLGDHATAAATGQVLPEHPAAVLTGKGTIGKGKDAKHLRHTVSDPKVRARLGGTRRTRNFGRVKSRAELVEKTKRAYAKTIRITHVGNVSTPFVPFVRRGDGIRLNLPSEGITGSQAYVFITAARHNITATEQTSEFEWTREDPFVEDRERREKEQRELKRQRRLKAAS